MRHRRRSAAVALAAGAAVGSDWPQWGGRDCRNGVSEEERTQKDFFITAAGKEAKLVNKIRLGNPAYMTPVVANGTVYVASQHYLWAVHQDAPARADSSP